MQVDTSTCPSVGAFLRHTRFALELFQNRWVVLRQVLHLGTQCLHFSFLFFQSTQLLHTLLLHHYPYQPIHFTSTAMSHTIKTSD